MIMIYMLNLILTIMIKAIWFTLKPKNPDSTRLNNIAYSIPFRVNKKGKNIRFTFINGITHIGEVELYTQLQAYPKVDGSLVYVKTEDKYYLYMKSSSNPSAVCDI